MLQYVAGASRLCQVCSHAAISLAGVENVMEPRPIIFFAMASPSAIRPRHDMQKGPHVDLINRCNAVMWMDCLDGDPPGMVACYLQTAGNHPHLLSP
jgi:hypothetical protein